MGYTGSDNYGGYYNPPGGLASQDSYSASLNKTGSSN